MAIKKSDGTEIPCALDKKPAELAGQAEPMMVCCIAVNETGILHHFGRERFVMAVRGITQDFGSGRGVGVHCVHFDQDRKIPISTWAPEKSLRPLTKSERAMKGLSSVLKKIEQGVVPNVFEIPHLIA